MRVRLNSAKNRKGFVEVVDLAAASKAVRAEITAHDLGASDCLPGFGDVFAGAIGGMKIARVSYNGRVWNLNGDEVTL